MNIDDIPASTSTGAGGRRLIPMKVGKAVVYVEQFGAAPQSEADDGSIHPVAPRKPQEAFQEAGEAVGECLRILGDQVDRLAKRARPQSLEVEFSLTFEGTGKAALIPIFVTAEAKTGMGLNVKAVWDWSVNQEGESGSGQMAVGLAQNEEAEAPKVPKPISETSEGGTEHHGK